MFPVLIVCVRKEDSQQNKQIQCNELSALKDLDLFAKSQDSNITNDNAQVFSTKSYTLNINRSLRHKIDACDKVHVEYEATGGGIRGIIDTGTFELFRLACSSFYKKKCLQPKAEV